MIFSFVLAVTVQCTQEIHTSLSDIQPFSKMAWNVQHLGGVVIVKINWEQLGLFNTESPRSNLRVYSFVFTLFADRMIMD